MVLRLTHDNFFKRMMGDLRVAKDFFTVHLPSVLLHQLDLNTLQIEQTSFIDATLKGKHTDMLYQVTAKEEQLVYLYLLIEHQSTSEPLMAFRLLYYIFQVLDRHIHKYKNRGKSPLPLPVVYPLVFYNGKEEFSAKRDIFNLFGRQEALARDIFLKPFNLVDVSKITDETLREHHWAALMEWCMLHSIERDFLPYIKYLGELLRNLDLKSGDSILVSMINYILSGMETQEAEKTIKALHQQMPPTLEKDMATIAEHLYNKGKIEGKMEGKFEGKREAAENIRQAIKGLKHGSSSEAIAKETDLSQELIEYLRQELIESQA